MKTSLSAQIKLKFAECIGGKPNLKAYLCPAGRPTIGYGFTSGVKMGDTMTAEEAEVAL